MTPFQANLIKLLAAGGCFGLLAWMDWAGIKDPDLKILVYQALTTLGIVHIVGSSSK